MTIAKKMPSWLELTDEGANITLRTASEINQVKVQRVSLRSPTVTELRAATLQAGGDAEKRELILFATLADAGTKDLEALTIVDYNRIQAGYFRLVEDDEPYPYDA
ncbi:phage tail assembly protein [Pseudomonas sp. QTF5]|uniref:phage tail assembly protein n=1 Tax=Pseudomonas sp. QTF5 TaxID=1435425 RepID=UPI0004B9EAAD|nr:phage tail assembly protein [Pseudomonas sp. QTF5]